MKKEPKRNIFSNIYPILADKHSIGHKIFFSMLWLFIVMACIIFIVSVVSSYVAMSGYTARYVESAGDQVYTTLSSTLDDYTEALNRLSSDSRILYQLYNLYSGRDSYSSAETVTSIGNIVGLMQGISSVEICAASGARTYYGEPITKGSITSSSLLRETFASQDILWNICTTELDNSDEIYLIMSKCMYFDDYSHETAGCVLMTISLEHLLDICTINSITDDMYVFITDSDNEVFLHTKNLHYGADFQPSFSYDTSKYASVIQIFDANMDGRQVSIACAPIAANGWTVYAVVPSYSMLKGTVISGIIILLSILVMLFICAVILIRVSMNISGPIQKLIYAMQNTGQGNLSEELALTLPNRYQFDEFRSLERGFNKMQKHLCAYIQEVSDYQYKQNELIFLKTEAELSALQQQINPHFLYNTLEAIFWTAYGKGDSEIAGMITALGNFFRTSINKGLEYITVNDEISNIHNYILLQKIRYGDKFDVEWDIEEKIRECKIIKLILQPIIENSLNHGLSNMEKGGIIKISAYRSKDDLIFKVADNGVGMTEAECADFLNYINSPLKDTIKSIGAKNVHQRLQLYYGKDYGLSVTRLPVGIEVVLRLKSELPTQNKHGL